MSLQDIIDWWNGYTKRKKEVVSCGAWPAAVPPWADIFIECCAEHDLDYSESEVLYARGVIEQNLELKETALEVKHAADEDFMACVRARYSKSYFFTRPLTKWWGEQYISLVLANGNRIWFSSVGVIIAEYESGDHLVIQLALRSAKQHASPTDRLVLSQAQAISRFRLKKRKK